ncbi:MAG: hypothetical protein JW834_04065 [Candidatus Diapherotrites archaeon]|nr:hypothetical protein [Candidatus Diapherotrites archaeon]
MRLLILLSLVLLAGCLCECERSEACVGGQCVPLPERCVSDAECGVYRVCVDGRCLFDSEGCDDDGCYAEYRRVYDDVFYCHFIVDGSVKRDCCYGETFIRKSRGIATDCNHSVEPECRQQCVEALSR